MVTSALCNWYTNGNTADDIATVADADLQTLVVNLTGIAADIGEKFRGFTQAARHRSNLSCNLCILAIIAWRQTIRPTCSHAIIYRLRVYYTATSCSSSSHNALQLRCAMNAGVDRKTIINHALQYVTNHNATRRTGCMAASVWCGQLSSWTVIFTSPAWRHQS